MSALVGGIGGAVLGAGIIGGGASIIGASMSSSAAKQAAQDQASASNYAAGLQKQEFDRQQQNQQPWLDAGRGALGQMSDPYFQHNFGQGDFQQDPGYQFRLQQGQNALQASAAASGGLLSGNSLQALTDYNQNSASNEYQNAYNRFNGDQTSRFNRLASIAGLGQNANSSLGQAGQNFSNSVGNIATSNANAQGAAGIASANAWGGALGNIGNGVGNNWMTMSMMNQAGSNPYQSMSPMGSMGTQYGSAGSGSFGGLGANVGSFSPIEGLTYGG